MTAVAEGQAAVVPAEETAPQDSNIETPNAAETKAEDNEGKTSPEAESEVVAETVEEKLTRLERDSAGKQKRIDRQTAANRRTQELYEKQRQENEKLSALIEKKKPDTEPNIDDYETHDEYNTAVKEHITKQAKAEAQQEFLAQKQQVEQQNIDDGRLTLKRTQEADYIVENPMYKASLNEVDLHIKTLDISRDTENAILDQLYEGNVPSVIDHFGGNNGEYLDDFTKITSMKPGKAAVEIYKIQLKRSSSPSKKETKSRVTPVKTVRGDSKATKTLGNMSPRELSDWANS